MEASNKYKNAQSREVTQRRNHTGWDWVKLSQRLEKRTNNRLNRIEESGKWKKVRKEKLKRDAQCKAIINEFKAERIDHDEYVRRIVKWVRQKDLPKTKKALMRALASDSDSDS